MMRTASIVCVLVVGMSASAHAGKYTCMFSENGKAPKSAETPCTIDTANANTQTCQYKFGGKATMVATCGAAKIDANLDGLLCAFTSSAPSSADFLKDTVEPSIENVVASLHKKAGFASGAVSVAGPTAANVSLGYTKGRGAPRWGAACHPEGTE